MILEERFALICGSLNYVRCSKFLFRKSYGLGGALINTGSTFETLFFVYDCHIIDFDCLDGAYFCTRATGCTLTFVDFCCHVITLS